VRWSRIRRGEVRPPCHIRCAAGSGAKPGSRLFTNHGRRQAGGLAPGVALAPGALNGAGASDQLRATRGRCATGPLANQQVRSVYQLAVTDERLTLQALRVAARHLALNACGLMLGAVLVRI
jgi:hypothetical protein